MMVLFMAGLLVVGAPTLRQFGYRAPYVVDATGLCVSGPCHVRYPVQQGRDRAQDIAHRGARLSATLAPFADTVESALDQRADIAGGLGASLGEHADFLRDHGE